MKFDDVVTTWDNPFGSLRESVFYDSLWWALSAGRCDNCGNILTQFEVDRGVLLVSCDVCESSFSCFVPDGVDLALQLQARMDL